MFGPFVFQSQEQGGMGEDYVKHRRSRRSFLYFLGEGKLKKSTGTLGWDTFFTIVKENGLVAFSRRIILSKVKNLL